MKNPQVDKAKAVAKSSVQWWKLPIILVAELILRVYAALYIIIASLWAAISVLFKGLDISFMRFNIRINDLFLDISDIEEKYLEKKKEGE
jgi:hypothetical protein